MSVQSERITPEVLRLTLDRPDRLNALSREMVADLNRALDDAAADPVVRVVILTGAGRGFCSGQDMQAAAERSRTVASGVVEKMHWQEQFAGMVARIRGLPQPVIAAVNGPAVGAGMGIALAADIRIASTAARFLVGSVRIGLSAGESGLSYHLARWIGAGRAFEILLTGRPIEAEEAHAIGLATRLVELEALAQAALDQAERILVNSPFAVTQTKRLMWRNLDAAGLDPALDLENRTQILATETYDYREATDAFVGKRRPDFRGA